ncbi:ORF6N domain-containing protein [Desulfonatronum thiodismutans]|uniref:ORF6N domain-containing protein n=1 Tax=Desulfonatronum thiodismutans TaxID=159290 RepID=UPI0004ABEA12|nr:ORF6N domain-containing protein [Desulfonatronum thiodismutans]
MADLVPMESITGKILVLRGLRVMLDRDLADLYGVETKLLKRQVRRNIDRFPDDFMFELTPEELNNWRCQFGTSKSDKMGLRYPPLAFTEQGVAMLSTVLNSKLAIQVNIQIMRAFTKLRQMLATHEDLRRKIEDMESRYDEQFRVVFEAIRQLLASEEQPERRIGFVREDAQEFGATRD